MKRDWSRLEKVYERFQLFNTKASFTTHAMTEAEQARAVQIIEEFVPYAVGARTVIDIGGKDGFAAEVFRTRGFDAAVVDCEWEYCRQAEKRGLETHFCDMHWIPVAAEAYDLVYASNVFEHSLMPMFLMAEFTRISRQYLLMVCPNFPFTMLTHWCAVPYSVLLTWFHAFGWRIVRFGHGWGGMYVFLLEKTVRWDDLDVKGHLKLIRECAKLDREAGWMKYAEQEDKTVVKEEKSVQIRTK